MNRSGWESPAFADVLVGCEAFQGLQPPSVVGGDEVGKVSFELIVSIVMVALDGRSLYRAVHALDLAIGPGMLDLGQPMFEPRVLGMAYRTYASRILPSGRPHGAAGR